MEFTIDSIVNAINIANSPLGPNQNQTEIQDALSYIEQWTYSENGIFLAMQIISDNNLLMIHKVYAASLIKNQVPLNWGKIEPNIRLNLRTQFFDIFKSIDLPSDNTLFKIIVDILVIIAIFEFPQEWPELNIIFFSNLTEISNELEKSHYYSFIGQFITSFEETKLIIPARIQFLRNLFLDNIESLSLHITTCFSNENFVSDGLKMFNGFLKWAKVEQILPSLNLVNNLCFQFILNKKILPQTIECLKTLLLRRIDSLSFISLSPMVICSLGSPTSIFPEGKHITSDPQVFNFLLLFLTEHMQHLLTLFDPTSSSSLIESMKNTMIQMELGPQDLSQRLLYIINVFLSTRDPEFLTEDYWAFWSILFKQAFFEISSNTPDLYKPTYEFIKELLPAIRESLFQCLPLDHYNDNYNESNPTDIINNDYLLTAPFDIFFPNKSKNAWSLLANLDIDGMINFLKQQPPSVALCYGIGNLELCKKSTFDLSLLNLELTELYNICQSDGGSPEFYVSLLFCNSHTLSCDKDGQSFVNFIEFAIKCVIDENPPITTAATNALYYASCRSKAKFLNDLSLSTICDYSETYLKKLEHDDCVRMFKLASSLIPRLSSNEQMSQMFEKLASQLAFAMDAYFEPEKVFDCIREICQSADKSSFLFMSFLWPKVLEMTNQVIHSNQPSIILEKVIDAASIAMKNEPFNIKRFNLILSWMVERNQVNLQNHLPIDDCFYNFISNVHMTHREIDNEFPEIIQMFVEPAISANLINLAPMMNLLNSFGLKSFELPYYISLGIDSIRSLNLDDNIRGIECINFFINQNSDIEKFSIMIANNTLSMILSAVFAALTDMMHKSITIRYILIIRNIMNKAYKNNIIQSDEFTNIFINAIKQNVEEPMPGMFMNFYSSLKDCTFQIGFPRLFSDFLILIRRMSPNDADAFKSDEQKEINFQNSIPPIEGFLEK